MKDLILMIIAFVIVAAFVGHMEINLSPFSIKLPMWHRVVCMILLVITYILSVTPPSNLFSAINNSPTLVCACKDYKKE